MKNVFVLYFLFVVQSLAGQSSTPDCLGKLETTTAPASVCYVLCDFSASQDITIDNIIIHAKKVFDKEGKDVLVRYFAIGAPPMDGPFFEYFPLEYKRIMTPMEERTRKQYYGCMREQLVLKLQTLRQQKRFTSSCIIKVIEKTANELSNIVNKAATTVRIYVLSDMLEDCGFKEGKINLEKGNYKAAEMVLDKLPEPAYNFKLFRGITIKLIGSSVLQDIDTRSLNAFWRKVLAKYKYDFCGAIASSLL